MLRDLPWEDSLDLEAGALPELLGPALAPSTAQSTLQVLVLALEGLLAHGTLLIDTPELEEFGAEGLGFLLRGVQHRLRLLMPLSPRSSKHLSKCCCFWPIMAATERAFPRSDRASPSSSCSRCLALSREAFVALATPMASAASCNLTASFFLRRADTNSE